MFFLTFPQHRSGQEWLGGGEGRDPKLRTSVEIGSAIPPTTGWQFFNDDTEEYEEDSSLTCLTFLAADSPPCSITVCLKGLTKEIQGECEGEYKDTGLNSMGRQVDGMILSPPATTKPY